MKLHIYKSKDGWRWRLRARNGRIVAESGEAYERQKACEKAFSPLRWMLAKRVYDH